ncbi:hypothetical protein MET9862_04341 [Methylobacterium symbioticum]|uniref:Uncharacterized protein n=2 Tax=Methylobacterium symbioticum TaxID=2584084 RepID=A0A509EI20_9HYPH|nr:hypothetical protein MET9862_04341 [Methylobacterium symbioticum]
MRLAQIIVAAGLVGLAAPAAAQVRSGNPNAANESFSRQSESRGVQQDITTQNNTTRMDIQRSQTAPQAPPAGGGVVVPRR